MKKENQNNEITSVTRYLFTRYRLVMYGYLNRLLKKGLLSQIVGFSFTNTIINKQVCHFPDVQYWRINRTRFYADISVRLHLQTEAGLRIWKGYLTAVIEADSDGNISFDIQTLKAKCPDREELIMLSPFLVPYLKNQDMENEAQRIWKEYLPGIEPICTDRYALKMAENMGLSVRYLPLENEDIESILFFIEDTISTRDKDKPERPIEVISVPANTIVININNIKREHSAFSILHECVHYDEHILFFRLQEAKNNDASALHFKQEDGKRTCSDPVYWMERQANRTAYSLLLPGEDFALRTQRALAGVTRYSNVGDHYEKAIDTLSQDLFLPNFRIRARMIQLGHIDAKGACNYVDRNRIQPFAFDWESLPCEQHTFVIDRFTAYDLYREMPEFRELIDTGDYVYADGHIVRNTETYVHRLDYCVELTDAALDHIDQCALRFVRDYEQRQPEQYKHGRLYFDSDYVKQTTFYLNDTINRKQLDELDAQRDYAEHFPHQFRDAINLLAQQNGMNRDAIAERLGMDARTLDRWISAPDTKITADFVMMVSLELRLPDWISNLLFKRAHIQLDEDTPRHMAFRYIQRVLWMDGVDKTNEFLKSKQMEPLSI